MKLIFNYLFLFITVSTLISCNDDITIANNTQQCDSTNTTFNKLYNTSVNTPNSTDKTSYDFKYHTYTFEVLKDNFICKIGYSAASHKKPYLIEIFDNTTNTTVYSGSHIFSVATTSYVDIPPVPIITGHSYTIIRFVEGFGEVGRYVSSSLKFPIVYGDLKITKSSLYHRESDKRENTPADNFSLIPYIDIVFQN